MNYSINIGRQLGSGGRLIGHALADSFGISYYDKELLLMASKESGLCKEMFEKSDEHKGLFRTVLGTLAPFVVGNDNFYSNQISDESLFHIQSDTIRKAASKSSCVFIGRCADYVLRDMPNTVNIFVSADMDDRIHRLVDLMNIKRHEAIRMIEQGDEKRADYYNFYSSNVWGAAETYHLCINSSVLGLDGTTDFIKQFVTAKLHL